MAEQGCPLLGDLRYGGARLCAGFAPGRPLLHSSRLAFEHPVTARPLEFSLELPDDMAQIVDEMNG
jgi:23S rRNA pseudouridine1911/1915/1917 synthase